MRNAELVISGARGERRCKVSKEVFTIGRSEDNDLVVRDPAVSFHHCEIVFKGGKFSIVDRQSSNGTLLNGKEIAEEKLASGDKIRIGDTTLIFSERFSPVVTPPDTHGKSFFAERKRTGKLVLLILVAGVLCFLAMVFVNSPHEAMFEDTGFEIKMIEEQGGFEQLVRKEISVSGGNLLFYFDDIKNKRHIYRESVLSRAEVLELQRKIRRAGVFKNADKKPDNSQRTNCLTFVLGAASQEAKVCFAGDLPKEALFLKEQFELMVDEKFDIRKIQFSADEVVEDARAAFERGMVFYDNRTERMNNLYNALAAFEEALEYLATIEPKPEFFPSLKSYAESAGLELDEEFSRLRFQAERAIRFSDWERALSSLRAILAKIPDTSDTRHKYALRRFEKVENKCR